MKRYLILLAVALLSVVSCSVPRYVSLEPDLQDEWILRSHAEIVRSFGAPNREVSDGADGQILVYEDFYTTHETDEFMGDYTTTSQEYRNFKEFYLNADGICYDVRTNESIQSGRRIDWVETIFTALLIGATAAHFIF